MLEQDDYVDVRKTVLGRHRYLTSNRIRWFEWHAGDYPWDLVDREYQWTWIDWYLGGDPRLPINGHSLTYNTSVEKQKSRANKEYTRKRSGDWDPPSESQLAKRTSRCVGCKRLHIKIDDKNVCAACRHRLTLERVHKPITRTESKESKRMVTLDPIIQQMQERLQEIDKSYVGDRTKLLEERDRLKRRLAEVETLLLRGTMPDAVKQERLRILKMLYAIGVNPVTNGHAQQELAEAEEEGPIPPAPTDPEQLRRQTEKAEREADRIAGIERESVKGELQRKAAEKREREERHRQQTEAIDAARSDEEQAALDRVREELAVEGANLRQGKTSTGQPRGRQITTAAGQKRAPVHPGIEAVPEHLRLMPAGQTGGPVPQRIKAAEGQLLVYNAVNNSKTSVGTEIVRALENAGTPVTKDRVAFYLRELEKAGLVKRTGLNRFDPVIKAEAAARGRHPGRASVEYRGLTEGEPVEPTEINSPTAIAQRKLHKQHPGGHLRVAGGTMLSEEQIRDFVSVQKDTPFGIREMTSDLQVSEGTAKKAIDLALEKGWIEPATKFQADKRPGAHNRHTWRYKKPKEAGKAAEMDQARRQMGEPVGGGSGGGGPVAGTGRQWEPTNPDWAAFIRLIRRAGATVNKPAGSGHVPVVFVDNSGKTVKTQIQHTPGGNVQRAVMNQKARLRRLGLKV